MVNLSILKKGNVPDNVLAVSRQRSAISSKPEADG
jgi:hypothetical protein